MASSTKNTRMTSDSGNGRVSPEKLAHSLQHEIQRGNGDSPPLSKYERIETEVSPLHHNPPHQGYSCGYCQNGSFIPRVQALEQEVLGLKMEMKKLKDMLLCHLLSKTTREGQSTSSGEGGSSKKREGREEAPSSINANKKQRVNERINIPLPKRSTPDPPTTFTPLNVPPAHILTTIEKKNYVRWPAPMRSNPDKRNKDKWCHFHNNHGHYTNDCRALKEMIEDLISRGYLREFIQG